MNQAHQNLMLPAVSFVMPVLNEAEHLEAAVKSVLSQNYPAAHELLLVLGPSTDGTSEIAKRLADADSRITLLHNPAADIPIGLNIAFYAAQFDFVIRVDAHSNLSENYATTAITTLLETGAANVGGIMQAAGASSMQQAIADCYNSPFGLGGGAYHSDGEAGPAESAYLGVFSKAAVQSVGGFDPQIRRGEDWELNLRLRHANHTVWFEPSLRVTYFPRASLKDLAKQFFATGVWRAVLVKRHPRLHPWRFFVPGTLVLLLLASCATALAGVISLSLGGSALLLGAGLAVPAAYLAGIAAASCTMPRRGLKVALLRIASLATMHISWGAGFIKGLLRGGSTTVDTSRLRG